MFSAIRCRAGMCRFLPVLFIRERLIAYGFNIYRIYFYRLYISSKIMPCGGFRDPVFHLERIAQASSRHGRSLKKEPK